MAAVESAHPPPRYAGRMGLFLDSFWRAVAYCLHPRVIALSFLPLVIMIALSLGLGYFYWDAALQWVRAALESSDLMNSVWDWLQGVGAGKLKTVVAPLIVIFAVPPLILLLPPLIWGWLTYRVMAFDALSDHASRPERREVFRRHRMRLLGIGVLTGYLGAAPSILWASGALFAAAFVILVPLAIWIYTLVFAFSSLWF